MERAWTAQIFAERSAWKPGRSVQRRAGGAPNLTSTSSRPWSRAAATRKYLPHLRKRGVSDQFQVVAICFSCSSGLQAWGLGLEDGSHFARSDAHGTGNN